MAMGATKFCRYLLPFLHNLQFCSIHCVPSSLQETIKQAVRTKSYERIPDVLACSGQSSQSPNPFSFLSTYPQSIRSQLIDEILQSFIPIKPRSRTHIALSCLLSHTLQNPNPLPVSLAVLQRTLRSGCVPVPQTHLLLSSAWIERRRLSRSRCVAEILLEMRSIGYSPDSGTFNYLILSLCAVDRVAEAVEVLKGLSGSGCVPDSGSYGAVIGSMCRAGRSAEAADMVERMVVEGKVAPRQGTLVGVVAALRASGETMRAVEVVEVLVREGYGIGFEVYESVVEACLECGEFVLAGKVVIGMADRGFIPYIKVRQKVVEKLAGIGEWKLACTVRQRFADLKS